MQFTTTNLNFQRSIHQTSANSNLRQVVRLGFEILDYTKESVRTFVDPEDIDGEYFYSSYYTYLNNNMIRKRT